MRRHMILLIVLICTQACFALPQVASQQMSSDRELSEYVWKGVGANLASLRSGTFRGKEDEVIYKDSEKVNAFLSDIFYSFDTDRNLLRFDRKKVMVYPSVRVVDEKSSKLTSTKTIESLGLDTKGSLIPANPMRVRGGKYFNDQKSSTSYIYESGTANIDKSDTFIPVALEGFDIKHYCLAFFNDRFDPISYEQTIKSLSSVPLKSVVKESSIYRLEYATQFSRRVIWIDESKNFSIVQLEVSSPDQGDTTGVNWQKPWLVRQLDWMKIGNDWVPSQISTDFRMGDLAEERQRAVLKLSLQWTNVNTSTDEKNFTLADFNLSDGTYIVDRRLGKPIVERIIGGASVPDYLRGLTPLPEPIPNNKRYTLFTALAIINAIVVATFLVYLIRSRRLRSGDA